MAEFLDVFDGARNHIGTADRDVVHAFALWHKTIHCWLVIDNMIVFQRRSAKADVFPNTLNITASGHVSAGETVEQAFVREVKEELGIAPENPKKLFEFVWVADMAKRNGTKQLDRAFANVFFVVYNGKLSDLTFQDGEVDAAVAFDLRDYIAWTRNGAAGELSGKIWDGKNLSNGKFSVKDFMLAEGETLYEKSGIIAERIAMTI
ncbi:MAG: NUDIX domain-containing protein [Proteobacteria bacterium]|nr:NUDIX domain-containing protein [Pseudomonadota bacterium]